MVDNVIEGKNLVYFMQSVRNELPEDKKVEYTNNVRSTLSPDEMVEYTKLCGDGATLDDSVKACDRIIAKRQGINLDNVKFKYETYAEAVKEPISYRSDSNNEVFNEEIPKQDVSDVKSFDGLDITPVMEADKPKKASTFLICHVDSYLDLESIYQYGLKLKELNANNPEISHLFLFAVDENGNVNKNQVMGLKIGENSTSVVKVPADEMEKFGQELGFSSKNNFSVLIRNARDNTKEAMVKIYDRTLDSTGKIVLKSKETSHDMVDLFLKRIEKASLIATYKKEAIKQFIRDTIKKGSEVTDEVKADMEKKAEDRYKEMTSKYKDFDEKKDKTFDNLTKNLLQARAQLQEAVMSRIHRFMRAKDAVKETVMGIPGGVKDTIYRAKDAMQIGMAAGKEAWKQSKEAKASLKIPKAERVTHKIDPLDKGR